MSSTKWPVSSIKMNNQTKNKYFSNKKFIHDNLFFFSERKENISEIFAAKTSDAKKVMYLVMGKEKVDFLWREKKGTVEISDCSNVSML